MKIEQAKQIAGKAIDELSHALEAGHSGKIGNQPALYGSTQRSDAKFPDYEARGNCKFKYFAAQVTTHEDA
jgi:hypothetical protein